VRRVRPRVAARDTAPQPAGTADTLPGVSRADYLRAKGLKLVRGKLVKA
jgi:hypothetical protein